MALLDDFESGLDNWVVDGVSRTSLYSYSGSYSVRWSTNTSAHLQNNWNYISNFQRGDVIEYFAKLSNINSYSEVRWGYASGLEYYNFRVERDQIRIRKYDFGNSTIGSTTFSDIGPSWYRIRLSWETDGTIEVSIYDTNDVLLHSVSTVDTEYSTGGSFELYGYLQYVDDFGDGQAAGSQDVSATAGVLGSVAIPPSFTGGIRTAIADLGSLSVTAQTPSVSTPSDSSDVTDGLLSKWELDGDATDSVGMNGGTATNVSYQSGYIGQAASFNASSSIVEIPDSSSLSQPTFSVSAWVNLNATSSGTDDIRVVASKNNGYSDRAFWIVHWDGEWQARVGSNAVTVNGGPSATGAWTHLVLTYSGSSNQFNFYVDGVLKDTNTESTLGGGTAPFRIGAEATNNRVFDGLIDDVRYYFTELTASQVSDLHAWDGTTAPTALNLLAETASVSLSPPSPTASPGPVSFAAGSSGLSSVGTTAAFSPGSTAVSGQSAAISVTSLVGGVVPGPIGATGETGELSSAAFPTSIYQDGLLIGADPGVLTSGVGPPSATAGSVLVSAETAGIASSSAPAAFVPNPIQVIGNVATGAVEAVESTVIPGSVSAVAETGSAGVAAQFSSVSAGGVSVQTATGNLVLVPAELRLTGQGTILADAATGLLVLESPEWVSGPVSASVATGELSSAAFASSVVPAPVSVRSAAGSSTVSVPEAWSLTPSAVSASLAGGGVVASAADSSLTVGAAPISAIPGGVALTVPAGFELSSKEIENILRVLGVVDGRESVVGAVAQNPELLVGIVNGRESVSGAVAQDPELLGTVDLRTTLGVILRK